MTEAIPEPQWVRHGECQRCGRCCSQVITTLQFNEELRDYLEWLSLHQNITVRADKDSGIAEVEIRSKCRMLKFKNGKASCRIYDKRPKICRDFPMNPSGTGSRGCPGFTFTLESPADPTNPPE
jgi:Fe-S-cluster containining protein